MFVVDCSNPGKWLQYKLIPIKKKSFGILRKPLQLIRAYDSNAGWGKHIYTESNACILDRNLFVSRFNKSKVAWNKI